MKEKLKNRAILDIFYVFDYVRRCGGGFDCQSILRLRLIYRMLFLVFNGTQYIVLLKVLDS